MCKRVRFRTREKENVSITFRSNKLCIKRSKHYIYHVKLSIELRCVIYTLLCFYTYWNFCCHKILLLVCSVRSQIYYSNIIALYAPPIKMRSISSSERHDLYYCNRIKWRVVVKLLYAWWLCTLNILLLLFENSKYKVQYQLLHRVMQISIMIISLDIKLIQHLNQNLQ